MTVAAGDGTFDASVPLDAPIEQLVASTKWYHSFDLPGGISTNGFYDHRRMAHKVPIPNDLSGKRCLDVASSDGFWAFRMAEHGAGEVVSVDLDDASRQDWQGIVPEGADLRRGTGRAHRAFDIVNRARGAGVKRCDLSVYDLSPETLGTFDFVFMGNVLLHLRDPAEALNAVRSVCAGEFLSFECVSMPLTVLRPFTPCAQLWHDDEPRWWTPNVAGHRRLLRAAGFEILGARFPILQPFGQLIPRRPRSIPWRMRDWAFWLFARQFGVASQWVRSRPAPAAASA
ncbi:MAG: class I SAM-dependent methyltransferase [Actinobacteria bacterium]|nr:class I SAM-dependent methyltransferase [Actinomycetota bacterium]